jgi:hypothetical protein
VAYQYDIFISYKRHTETLGWIKKHFFPLLEHRVGLELGRDPEVFVHEVAQQIPAGANWPVELGETLAGSRILVALWTKNYFNSRWCAEELSHMLAREQLSEKLGEHAGGLAAAIENAPPWQADWPAQAARDLVDQFYVSAAPTQNHVPRFNPR